MTSPTREEALAHFGVKGMKWGVTTKSGGGGSSLATAPTKGAGSRKEASKTVRALGGNARELIRESRRAESPAARKKIAKRYEKEVLEEIKTPEFKAAYKKASTMGKGEMAVHALVLGPLALVSIPAGQALGRKIGEAGYEMEIDVAHDILREMRS